MLYNTKYKNKFMCILHKALVIRMQNATVISEKLEDSVISSVLATSVMKKRYNMNL